MTGLSPAESLRAHLAWTEGPWLGFVFSEDEGPVRTLAAQVAGEARAHTIRPTTPQQLREGVPRLLEGPSAPLTWMFACFGEAEPGPSDPPGPWWEASDWFLMRANERRQPLLDHLGGGLLIALPVRYRSRVPMAAPDLWSVRALVLDLPGPPPPPAASLPPVDRRVDAALRRLAFQQRMRTDPWHAIIRAKAAEDRSRLQQRAEEVLPGLLFRPLDEDLWVGVEPGETSPSLVMDLDAPLPTDPPEDGPDPELSGKLGDPLSPIDATLRTAAATWSQGWASETLEFAERALEGLPPGPARPDDDRRRAAALELTARSRRELGDRGGAVSDLHEAVSLRRRLAKLHGDDEANGRRELARALSLRGQLFLEGPAPASALPDLEESLSLRSELAQWSDDPESLAERALAHSLIADARSALAEQPEELRAAEHACREALALRRRIAEAVDAPRHRRQLGLAWGRLARVLTRQLYLREAEHAWLQAVTAAAEVASTSDHPVHRVEESVARTQLAAVRWQRGDRQGARQEVERAISQRRQLLADDPANARWAERLAVALGQGAQQALDDGDHEQARAWAEEAVTVGEQLVASSPSQIRGLALAHLRLGDVHAAMERHDDAAVSWARARDLLPSLEALSAARAAQLHDALALRQP